MTSLCRSAVVFALAAVAPWAIANEPSDSAHAVKADVHSEQEVKQDVQKAVDVLEQMQAESQQLREKADQAKALFVLPDHATAALVLGASGGEGVLFVREGESLTRPVFYDVGGVSLGAQIGGSAGSMVMLLMTDNAVAEFEQKDNFSLSADAELTIVNWSAEASASTEGDIVLWSDKQGLLAQANVGVSDIRYDDEETRAYYGTEVTPQQILNGAVQNPHAAELETEFASWQNAKPETKQN